MHEFLKIGPRISVLPVIHGSGDFAVAVRRAMLSESFDCLAVPLPPSFQEGVEAGVLDLPVVTAVVQEESSKFSVGEPGERSAERRRCSYVPIDPCQPVIAALRIAMQEHIPRAFIDREVESFDAQGAVFPDPYALKRVSVESFSAALLPALPRPTRPQLVSRHVWMAARLRELAARHKSVLFVCSVTDWPWIREACIEQKEVLDEHEAVFDPQRYRVDPQTLVFLLTELPYITGLYERARTELDDDENLSVDGVKEMLLSARKRYRDELKGRARKITPHMLAVYLRYVRNLSLVERRMTPDLYTLIIAAKQITGDSFAIHLAETAREYPYDDVLPLDEISMSIGRSKLPDGEIVDVVSRLPGPLTSWRRCELNRRPLKVDREEWSQRWNPFSHCSWPPEDQIIERFRTHVKDRALTMLGTDLARSEKFTSSMKDGLDIRETLRNWHTGDLYVKVLPPSRGHLDCVIMLFEAENDPRDYPWRITWHAEHQDESTLSFFATDYRQELIGPGIASATYGGALFLFPPRPVHDIWRDHRFDYVDTLEERLLVAGCHHSSHRHVAVLSPVAPGIAWRRLAKRYGKTLVHVPLGSFSQETIQQMRTFHVLNGKHVRSYAEHFIRKA